MASPKWLSADYVYAALSKPVVSQLLDDDSDEEPDPEVMDNLIVRSEAHVKSYVLAEWGSVDKISAQDELFRAASLEFFQAFAADRHPEVQRENGDRHFARGVAIMKRIQAAVQRPTEEATATPATTGGFSSEPGPRLIVSGEDGTNNAGDF